MGASAASGTELARAFVTVQMELGQLRSELSAVRRDVESSVSGMQNSLGSLKGTLGTILGLAGVSLSGMGIYQLGKQLLFASDASAKLKNSFTTLLEGNADAADALIKKMRAFAAETPFTEQMVSQAVTAFLPFKKDMNELFDTIRAIGDAASVSAEGLQSFPRVSRAITQMYAKGRIQAEEMMQLAEAGIQPWQTLGKAMGQSVAQVQAVAASGKMGVKEIDKFVKQLGVDYAGSMEKQSKTIEGLLSTISDNIKIRAVSAFEPLYVAAQATFSKVADAVQSSGFISMMDTMGIVLKGAMKSLEALADRGGKAWEEIGPMGRTALVTIVALPPAILLLSGAWWGFSKLIAFAVLPQLSVLGSVLGAMSGIIGLSTIALAAGIVVWAKYSEAGQKSMALLKQTFGAVWDAMVLDDWGAALEVGMLGVKVAFFRIVEAMQAKWGEFGKNLVDDTVNTVADVKQMFNSMSNAIAAVFAKAFLSKLGAAQKQTEIKMRQLKFQETRNVADEAQKELEAAKTKGDAAGVDKARKKLENALAAHANAAAELGEPLADIEKRQQQLMNQALEQQRATRKAEIEKERKDRLEAAKNAGKTADEAQKELDKKSKELADKRAAKAGEKEKDTSLGNKKTDAAGVASKKSPFIGFAELNKRIQEQLLKDPMLEKADKTNELLGKIEQNTKPAAPAGAPVAPAAPAGAPVAPAAPAGGVKGDAGAAGGAGAAKAANGAPIKLPEKWSLDRFVDELRAPFMAERSKMEARWKANNTPEAQQKKELADWQKRKDKAIEVATEAQRSVGGGPLTQEGKRQQQFETAKKARADQEAKRKQALEDKKGEATPGDLARARQAVDNERSRVRAAEQAEINKKRLEKLTPEQRAKRDELFPQLSEDALVKKKNMQEVTAALGLDLPTAMKEASAKKRNARQEHYDKVVRPQIEAAKQRDWARRHPELNAELDTVLGDKPPGLQEEQTAEKKPAGIFDQVKQSATSGFSWIQDVFKNIQTNASAQADWLQNGGAGAPPENGKQKFRRRDAFDMAATPDGLGRTNAAVDDGSFTKPLVDRQDKANSIAEQMLAALERLNDNSAVLKVA